MAYISKAAVKKYAVQRGYIAPNKPLTPYMAYRIREEMKNNGKQTPPTTKKKPTQPPTVKKKRVAPKKKKNGASKGAAKIRKVKSKTHKVFNIFG